MEIPASLKFLLDNQVVLPVLISGTVAYLTIRRDNAAEEDENFIRLKEQYRDLWSKLVGLNHKSLMEQIENVESEEARLLSFQMVEFFYMVWFLNYNKSSRFQKQWDQNLNHVFKHILIQSTFKKHADQFDTEYQIFIQNRYLKKEGQ